MKTNMVEIISDGNTAKVLVNGADLAGAITKLEYVHEAGSAPRLKLTMEPNAVVLKSVCQTVCTSEDINIIIQEMSNQI
ncbi:hypothetical protein [Anaerotruncus rubiinfantis]|uniref:hypothetical protein n=1 Tax=Anaerotruncus rubiinfantis TaxID=1720200 RepID=UPI0018978E47|nr:hypothetical protein [Anaerotruncus rubiinfantis]